MRPTFAIICFTVLSGAGYGLLFLLGLGFAFGGPLAVPADAAAGLRFLTGSGATPAIALATGTLLVTLGLIASTGHLGRPSRAWRAFSQWRSSWLSREGVLALLTYVPVLAIAWLLFAHAPTPVATGIARGCGVLLALASLATVYCTANIYACLKPIRAWHNAHVVPAYLLLGLYTGTLWLLALGVLPTADAPTHREAMRILWLFATLLVGPACAWWKSRYWRWLDALSSIPDAGAATGLDRLGTVRSFEQPHTEENYLTHEMGFVLARKHAQRLRAIAFWLILLAPAALWPLATLIGWPAAWPALLAGMTGIFIERWLFFAEARHAVIAYYGH